MKIVAARQLWCSGKLEFCCAEMSFFVIGLLCMSEKNAFIANQKNFISRNFTNFTQSLFTHKNFFCTCLSSLSEKISIYTNQKLLKAYEPPSKAALLHTKVRYLHKPFLAVRKNFPFLQTKSLSFAQTFFIAIQSNSFLPSVTPSNHP